jgi:hypothetical protein
MKREEVDIFEKAIVQLEALHSEVSILSKKSPNDGLNLFKLGLVNSVLQEANKLLGVTYKPFPDFSAFEQDAVPSNSDVAFIISQYITCMEKLRSDNIFYKDYTWQWRVDDDETIIKTTQPKKLDRR